MGHSSRKWRAQIATLVAVSFLFMSAANADRHHLSSAAAYHKYIDPLLAESNFGVEYTEGGGGDASVLYPLRNGNPYAPPSSSVIGIVRAGAKAFPALVDCLTDGRTTSVYFDGNNITERMKVPVGYVCLDILMAIAQGPGIKTEEEADGLGGDMNTDFYFRPNDYANCWPTLGQCDIEPWVAVVQKSWTKEFLKGQLQFRNPYDKWRIPEYSAFTTEGLKKDRSRSQKR